MDLRKIHRTPLYEGGGISECSEGMERNGSEGMEGGCVLSAARSLRIGTGANELSDSPSTNPSLNPEQVEVSGADMRGGWKA